MNLFFIRDPLKGPLPPPPLVAIPKKAFKGLFVTKKASLGDSPLPVTKLYRSLQDPLFFFTLTDFNRNITLKWFPSIGLGSLVKLH